MKNAVINKYSIEVIGTFDEEKYLDFIKENADSMENDFDPKLFFRVCSFFRPNGCHLDKVNLQSDPFKAIEIIEAFSLPSFGGGPITSIEFSKSSDDKIAG